MLVELMNTSAATAAATALVGGVLALTGIVLERWLRRFGKTLCEFTDWTLEATSKEEPSDPFEREHSIVAPARMDQVFVRENSFSLRVSFRLFNGRDLPTALSEPRIYFLKGGVVLTCTSLIGRIDTLKAINLPSREWVEMSTFSPSIKEQDRLAGFDSVELRAKYPGSDRERFKARVPKTMLIPVEKEASRH